MNQKVFNCIAGVLFSVITLLHVIRLIFGWEVVVAGWSVPHWASGAALVVSGFLAISAFRLSKQS